MEEEDQPELSDFAIAAAAGEAHTQRPLYRSSQAPPKFTSRSHRPFSAIRQSIDVAKIETMHRSHIQDVLCAFDKTESKQHRAYLKMNTHPRVIPGLGKRMKDRAVIETIMNDRNARWRAELNDGREPAEIKAPIVKRPPLPHENPRKVRKAPPPVFYWG